LLEQEVKLVFESVEAARTAVLTAAQPASPLRVAGIVDKADRATASSMFK